MADMEGFMDKWHVFFFFGFFIVSLVTWSHRFCKPRF